MCCFLNCVFFLDFTYVKKRNYSLLVCTISIVTPHPPLKRSPFCRRQYLHVVQHHWDQRELHHWTKSTSLRSTSLDEVHIIAKHIIECMCESLRNTSSTTKGGPPSPAGEGYSPCLAAARSRFGSCIINAIHFQNAASLPRWGRHSFTTQSESFFRFAFWK